MAPDLDLVDRFDLVASRADSIFASHQTADHLTEQDIAMILILHDPRLHHEMRRYKALFIVREIVAEMEQEAVENLLSVKPSGTEY